MPKSSILDLATLLKASQDKVVELEGIAATKADEAKAAADEASQAEDQVVLAKNQLTKTQASLAEALGIPQLYKAEIDRIKASSEKSLDELKFVNDGLAAELERAQTELEKLRSTPATTPAPQAAVIKATTLENKTPEKKSLWQRLNENF